MDHSHQNSFKLDRLIDKLLFGNDDQMEKTVEIIKICDIFAVR